tara:strand:- start:88 stop:369 length:282 start_codon:yes stop_codon:yes gene_type:complete
MSTFKPEAEKDPDPDPDSDSPKDENIRSRRTPSVTDIFFIKPKNLKYYKSNAKSYHVLKCKYVYLSYMQYRKAPRYFLTLTLSLLMSMLLIKP